MGKDLIMNKELLLRIYNTLLQIETKGESTMLMADCIRALQTVINTPDEVKDEQGNEDQNGTGDSDIA